MFLCVHLMKSLDLCHHNLSKYQQPVAKMDKKPWTGPARWSQVKASEDCFISGTVISSLRTGPWMGRDERKHLLLLLKFQHKSDVESKDIQNLNIAIFRCEATLYLASLFVCHTIQIKLYKSITWSWSSTKV